MKSLKRLKEYIGTHEHSHIVRHLCISRPQWPSRQNWCLKSWQKEGLTSPIVVRPVWWGCQYRNCEAASIDFILYILFYPQDVSCAEIAYFL